ncbi:hypothetical protein HYS42_00425 [Candidatus Saccharibacteria bacterium]|nr:hypothetical protein [Candidatus Saccharibacteria bacterium]
MQDRKKPGLIDCLGEAFWKTIEKWGGALLIGIGLSQLAFGPYRLSAAFFIPGGLFIIAVQYFTLKRE